jgi:predicted aspartyl protease
MPHFTVVIGSDGPAIDLAIATSVAWQRRLSARGGAVPSPQTVRALIDTGSDVSVVHPQVLKQLGVPTTGSVRIRRLGAGGSFQPAPVSEVQLSIGGLSPIAIWIATRVVSVGPSTPTILALLGRDVLAHCTFFYNGPLGELTLSL